MVGRSEGQAPEVDGQVHINEGVAHPGEFVTIEVPPAHDDDLVGRVVEHEPLGPHKLGARTAVPSSARGEDST